MGRKGKIENNNENALNKIEWMNSDYELLWKGKGDEIEEKIVKVPKEKNLNRIQRYLSVQIMCIIYQENTVGGILELF